MESRLPPLYIAYEPLIPVHSSPTHLRFSNSTFSRKRFNLWYSFSKWFYRRWSIIFDCIYWIWHYSNVHNNVWSDGIADSHQRANHDTRNSWRPRADDVSSCFFFFLEKDKRRQYPPIDSWIMNHRACTCVMYFNRWKGVRRALWNRFKSYRERDQCNKLLIVIGQEVVARVGSNALPPRPASIVNRQFDTC